MNLRTKIEVAVFVILFFSVVFLLKVNKLNKEQADRQTANVENLTKAHEQELTLTHAEFEKADVWWKYKIDSLTKANKIKPKQVKSATIIRTEYKDTGSVKIVYKTPIGEPKKGYVIPVSYADSCWGMKGTILSTDPNSKLNIAERTAVNSAQLLVTQKRFLGFLWRKKKQTFKAYTDCGEIDFTKIEFTK
jgi:coenzyme F420-reducing hydrogenase alpha subunit